MARSNPRKLAHAKAMRRDPTWSEYRLLQVLRRKGMGVRWRRQHPIGPYVVDFVCLSRRVVVEADGLSHADDDPAYVAGRDRFFREQGFAVLHLSDDHINHDLDDALAAIRCVLDDPDSQWDFVVPG